MGYNLIDELIQSKQYPNVLHIFGEEDFLVEEAYHKLTQEILQCWNISYDYDLFDASELEKANKDNRAIIDICNSYPFMSEKRLVVIKNFDKLFSTKGTKKNEAAILFTKYFENPQPSTILIIISTLEDFFGISNELNNPKKRDKALKKIEAAKTPYNILFRNHPWVEFPKVYESQLRGWIKDRVNKYGKVISPEAIELLIAQTMNSLREINNEIEKLIVFLNDKKEIKIDDVSMVTGTSRQFNVFELQKEVGKRSLETSIQIIQNMLSNDRQEMLIITMLLRYFISLWKLSEEIKKDQNDYQLASKIGVNPFFIKEYKEAIKMYKPEQIERAFSALLNADVEIKTTSIDTIFIIQKMLIKIINGEYPKNTIDY